MNETESTNPSAHSSDERLMAALAHGSALFFFFGPIGPALIWAYQRKKSVYVTFHALQAMGYQSLFFWLWMIFILAISFLFPCLFIPLLAFVGEEAADSLVFPLVLQGGLMLAIFGFFGLFIGLGVLGGLFCLLDRDFRYPLLGGRLETYLQYNPTSETPFDETKVEQWVSGICHSTAILQVWGMLLPLAVWLTQKDSSPRLRFQAVQAIAYQFLAFLGYLGYMALYFVFFFGLILFAVVMPGFSQSGGNSIAGAVFVIFMFLMLVMVLLMMVVMPLYYLFALIATVSNWRGKDYRYPLLGNFLVRRMEV